MNDFTGSIRRHPGRLAALLALLSVVAMPASRAALTFTGNAPSALTTDSAGYSYLVFPTRPGYEYDVL